MYKLSIISVSFIVFRGLFCASFSQEIQFSQYDAFPLYLNPALTGQVLQQRLAITSRNQWAKITGAFNTRGVSYDYRLSRIKSGLGLVVMQDQTAGGGLTTFTAGGLYAYHLRINRKFFLHSGTRISYIQQRLDPAQLTFADQLIRNDGSPTIEIFDNLFYEFMDISWGNILIYYDSLNARNYWLGLALDHLNAPKNSFMDFESPLPLKYAVHGGGRYTLDKTMKGYPTSIISFSFLYKSQLKWDQAELGASYILRIPEERKLSAKGKNKKKSKPKFEPAPKHSVDFLSLRDTQMPFAYVEAGLAYRGIPFFKRYKPGYRNHDALIFLFGLGYADVKITYTFDYTISKIGYFNTAGAHEISLVYKFVIPH